MAKLKSLGEGARRASVATTRAIRKLLGRDASPPASTHNSSTSPDDNSCTHTQKSADPESVKVDPTTPITSISLDDKEDATETNGDMRAFNNSQNSRAAPKSSVNKENQPPSQVSDHERVLDHSSTIPVSGAADADGLTSSIGALSLDKDAANKTLADETPVIKCLTELQPQAQADAQAESQTVAISGLEGLSPEEVRAIEVEQALHTQFTNEALDMARWALKINETPVGCVLVRDNKVIARGMNATNVTRNGTRHAEFMAISSLLSYPPKDGPRTTSLKPKIQQQPTEVGAEDNDSTVSPQPQPNEGNEDGQKGHLYPYGQKEVPEQRVDRSILKDSVLYVTVEPCVMCASLLRQLGIKKVYFGAVNDKFGGTGGVFSIHANSLPVSNDGPTMSAHPQPPPTRLPGGGKVLGTSFPPSGGDGGDVEPGYEIEGGWGRDEAVGLLRRFYVQENGRAPIPRKKEGRAARLAAMEKDDTASVNSESTGGDIQAGDDEEDEDPRDNDPDAQLAEL